MEPTSPTTANSTHRPRTLPTDFIAESARAVTSDLQSLLDGRWVSVRSEVRKVINDPLFRPHHTTPIEQYREDVLVAMQKAAASEIPHGAFSTATGDTGDTGATLTAFEMFGHGDLSLMVKSGVQWGLFGGAIDNLGTQRHRDIAKQALELETLGCFGMTERGHGSDVQNLETTITYDVATGNLSSTPQRSRRRKCISGTRQGTDVWRSFLGNYSPLTAKSPRVSTQCWCLSVTTRARRCPASPPASMGTKADFRA